jgi:hypothetical protein
MAAGGKENAGGGVEDEAAGDQEGRGPPLGGVCASGCRWSTVSLVNSIGPTTTMAVARHHQGTLHAEPRWLTPRPTPMSQPPTPPHRRRLTPTSFRTMYVCRRLTSIPRPSSTSCTTAAAPRSTPRACPSGRASGSPAADPGSPLAACAPPGRGSGVCLCSTTCQCFRQPVRPPQLLLLRPQPSPARSARAHLSRERERLHVGAL